MGELAHTRGTAVSDDDLVTVATFMTAPEAHIARNALDAAGIRSVVTDGETVAMDWLLSNAIGGVKVQCRAADAERAAELINNHFGRDDVSADPGVDAAEMTDDGPHADETEAGPPPPDPDQLDAERQRNAYQLVFVAFFGLLFCPLQFYAAYLLLITAFGDGQLTPQSRFHLILGGMLNIGGLIAWWVIATGR
jgi:hypothetical protein